MKFTKMQGIGNDYVYVDCTKENKIENPAELSKKSAIDILELALMG